MLAHTPGHRINGIDRHFLRRQSSPFVRTIAERLIGGAAAATPVVDAPRLWRDQTRLELSHDRLHQRGGGWVLCESTAAALQAMLASSDRFVLRMLSELTLDMTDDMAAIWLLTSLT